MSTERKKECRRGMSLDEQIEAALRDGLFKNRSGIVVARSLRVSIVAG